MSRLPPGVTYRQLDHWTRAGLITPANGAPGSGRHRDWPPGELAVAATIGELRAAGVELTAAATIARKFAAGEISVRLTEHITIIGLAIDTPT